MTKHWTGRWGLGMWDVGLVNWGCGDSGTWDAKTLRLGTCGLMVLGDYNVTVHISGSYICRLFPYGLNLKKQGMMSDWHFSCWVVTSGFWSLFMCKMNLTKQGCFLGQIILENKKVEIHCYIILLCTLKYTHLDWSFHIDQCSCLVEF